VRRQGAALLVVFVLAIAGPARAETYLTPFAGAAFAGNTDDSKLTYGGDLAFVGSGPFGLSVDFGYTKDFFGATPSFVDNNVTTLMGNLMLISPGRPRIYVSGGAGLLKTRVLGATELFDVDSTDFGVNVGGGIYVVGGGALGFRADVRYFRALSDPDPDGEFDLDLGDLDFWRATAGITIKF
jgi:hypothetical protein